MSNDTSPDRPYDPSRDFMNPPDTVVVDGHRVSCDGGGGALGHPRVWLELGDGDFVDCLYCDRRFVKRGSPRDPSS